MKVANAGATQLTTDFRDWAAGQFGTQPQSPVFLLDIQGSRELKIGTSFANPVNAQFGRAFIVHLYRSGKVKNGLDVLRASSPLRFGTVLVIVAYAAQKNEWQALIDDLSAAEAPKALIDVRTIDESPSMEADIVIANLGRTSGEGFLSRPERIIVMATRARYAFFIFGSQGALRRGSHSGLPNRPQVQHLLAGKQA
ncbi:hypothetical protein G6O67_006869 [Ophiocordyceps sinensis]|uniref:DNA2/NAM7 helicase-like C-terminal domain-containing protein n=2 Tax=Ophiocordyceps sinensis TaxID=72228 RepID=A0A8H4PMS3_9HYPO|nr:MFS monocarboxylate transporter [Ophiocordyceps sinensis CO18]KAF4506828.1 hypothetical protein G6O67_006869 [Ophiocordyceps sinensis]